MTTFSLAQTAILAGCQPSPVANYKIPDDMVVATATTVTTATLGGRIQAMQLHTPLLCKGPDGALAYYRLDAERSTPSVPVLKPMTG